MTEPLRRSARRVKKVSAFSVGDIVEVVRSTGIAQGRLLRKLDDAGTHDTRWLVTFDGQSWKDEELYERSLRNLADRPVEPTGKPYSKAAPRSTSKPSPVSPPTVGRKAKNNARAKEAAKTKENKSGTLSSANSGDEAHAAKKKAKAVTFVEENTPSSDTSSPADGSKLSARVSAREERCRRRQALLEDKKKPLKRGRKRVMTSQSAKKMKADPNEEVVEVPMLTGTLYLYRGPRPRAAFIRRV